MEKEYSKKSFKISSKEEAILFGKYLNQYLQGNFQGSNSQFDMGILWDFCQKNTYPEKLFASFFDLILLISHLEYNIYNIGATWNSFFSKDKFTDGSIFDNPIKFNGKMSIHRHGTSFVYRYRSAFDKIMGIFIFLSEDNDKYEQYNSSKSRLKEFKKIIGKNKFLDTETLDHFIQHIQKFDEQFRTSEIHGNGRLRKWTFLMEPIHKNPQVELIGYWNYINLFLQKINNFILKSEEKNASSEKD